ncbi:MAG: hypothetical protein QOF25_1344 [Mycobacterium sp.]|jgi:hypothetical protein|nr:hypothetical protein [Mycobacterium sp.]
MAIGMAIGKAFLDLANTSKWHPEQMAKEIDPARARSAVAVIKQHPGMVLFLTTPALLVVGVVWLITGSAAWAGLLLVALVLGGGAAMYAGLKRR